MKQRMNGGCKCGLVRYQGTLLDAPMFRCHCCDCQQLTGSGHSEMVPMKRDGFVISAECRVYEMTGGSGQSTYSSFCPNCGSQLLRRSQRNDDRLYVHASWLDDPHQFRPAKSIYVASAQTWDAGSVIAD